MDTILVIIHLFLAIGLVGLILIQHGKGADAGAAFGSGASATVFGARGSANFLSRATGILALLFFVTSMALAWAAMNTARDAGLMVEVAQPLPATDVPLVAPATEEVPSVPEAPVAVTADAEVPAVPVVEETDATDSGAAPVVPAEQN